MVDVAIAWLMLFAIMPIYGVGFRASLIMLIALVALMALAAETFRIWTPALNVKYRDIGYVLPFAIQIMMFSDDGNLSSRPDFSAMAIVLRLNPLSGIIEGFRDAIFGRRLIWICLGVDRADCGSLPLTSLSYNTSNGENRIEVIEVERSVGRKTGMLGLGKEMADSAVGPSPRSGGCGARKKGVNQSGPR